MSRRIALFLASVCSPMMAQYSYYYTDTFYTIDLAKWNNAGLNPSGQGLYSAGNIRSLLSVPDGTYDYEVKMTIGTLAPTSYIMYLRAWGMDCSNGFGGYAIILTDTGSLLVKKNPLGPYNGASTLLSTTVQVASGMVARASIRSDGPNAGILIHIGSTDFFVPDYSITGTYPNSGPGAGLCFGNPPSGSGITSLALGPMDRVAPSSPTGLHYTSYPTYINLLWNASTDNTNGVGVWRYLIYRDGSYVGTTKSTGYVDSGLAVNTSYNYTVYAEDLHGNRSTVSSTLSASTSSTPMDPRQIGIRPTANYWGAMGEQIDVFSGNLNFRLPLLKAVGRGSWSVGFSLSYNSQIWDYQSGTTSPFGKDTGYGWGWRLLAGSLIAGPGGAYYVFTDSTGAEHKLGIYENGVWRGNDGSYVYYDENLHRVYFQDGSFWQMDCISGASEQDAGTRYPTLMEDSNGNQVVVAYKPAIGSSTLNTSSRVSQIADARTPYSYAYTFSYSTGSSPHLTSIWNSVGTSENYTFSYSAPTTLVSPFGGGSTYGAEVLLTGVTVTGLNISHTFETNASGELTKVIFPYGGEFRYTYATYSFSSGRQLREVYQRNFLKNAGATPAVYYLGRAPDDSTRPIHLYGTIYDDGAPADKVWWFNQATDWQMGLLDNLSERKIPSYSILRATSTIWALSPSGVPFVSLAYNYLDVGTANEKASLVGQTIDAYGNLLAKNEHEYGNLITPARVTTCTYVTTDVYIRRFLRNLPLTCTLTAGGQTFPIGSWVYDTSLNPAPVSAPLWNYLYGYDALSMPDYTARGNLSSWTQGAQKGGASYDRMGRRLGFSQNGSSASATYADTTSLPSTATSTSVTTTLGYTTFQAVSSFSGSNGTSGAFSYDSYARPSTRSTPDGNVTMTYTTSPPTKTETLGGVWTKTYYDGVGRTIKTETGDAGGTKSIVETEYAPCACSPTGKMSRVTRPYAPGGTPQWTTYTYDALGRTLSVSLPGGAGTTTSVYAGNATTITGPSGKWKKATTDAFGNLIQVNEPNPQGGADYVTTYAYNGLNQITSVSMPRPNGGGSYTQTRTFVYNTKGLLTSETHPESGTSTYTYDPNTSKPITKIDAKGLKTTWDYNFVDGRLAAERHYNAVGVEQVCEAIIYKYDYYSTTFPSPQPAGFQYQYGLGRLTEIQGSPSCTPAPALEQYAYDSNGRMTAKAVTVAGASVVARWDTSFNQMTGLYYPRTTRSVAYSLDSMKRLSGAVMTLSGTPSTLVDMVQYGVAGELTQLRSNGVTETRAYNALGQLTGISYNGTLRHEYRYSATNNDGRITSYKNWATGEDVAYTYDSLGRLTLAETVGPEWGQSFGYDGWGNLLSKTVTKGSATTLSVTADPATNRISGPTYDANGNMTSGTGVVSPVYDGRNRMVSDSTATRTYDASNRRTRMCISGTCYYDFYLPNGQNLGTYTVTSGVVAWVVENMYFGGRLVKVEGKKGSPGYVEWPLQDRLSSTVLHLPYGEERTPTAQERVKFATYWRESSGTLDYAQNRYYSPVYGRFTSADPYRASGGPTDPGSWNRYVYTRGDPANRVDRSGLADEGPPQDPAFTICPDGSTIFYGNACSPVSEAGFFSSPMPTFFSPNWINLYLESLKEARSLLAPAIDRALTALSNGPCQALFGSEESRKNGFDPSSVLKALYSAEGGEFGGVWVGSAFMPNFLVGFGKAGAATTPVLSLVSGTSLLGYRVDIAVGEWLTIGKLDAKLDSGYSVGTEYNALLLLHEMGHIYGFLSGANSGGSQIGYDGPFGSTTSQKNNELIIEKCGLGIK